MPSTIPSCGRGGTTRASPADVHTAAAGSTSPSDRNAPSRRTRRPSIPSYRTIATLMRPSFNFGLREAVRVAKSPEGLDLESLLDRIESEMGSAAPLVQWTMNECLRRSESTSQNTASGQSRSVKSWGSIATLNRISWARHAVRSPRHSSVRVRRQVPVFSRPAPFLRVPSVDPTPEGSLRPGRSSAPATRLPSRCISSKPVPGVLVHSPPYDINEERS